MKYTFLALFLILNASVFAQSEFDSLNTTWLDLSQDDTTRYKARFEYAKQVSTIEGGDSALIMFRKLVRFAESLDGKYRPLALQAVGITHNIKSNFDSALVYADSSLAIFRSINYTNGIITGLINRAKALQMLNKDSLAFIAINEGIRIAMDNQDTHNLIIANGNLAAQLKNSGKALEALDMFERNYRLSTLFKKKAVISDCASSLAFQYYQVNNLHKAIEMIEIARDHLEGVTDLTQHAALYQTLGNIYKELGSYEKAIEYFEQTADLYEKMDNRLELAGTWYNISRVFGTEDKGEILDFNKAIKYANMAQDLFIEVDSKMGLTYTYNLLGEILLVKKEYDLAIEKFNSGLALIPVSVENLQLSYMLGNLAKVYHDKGDYKKAIQSAERAKTIAHRMHNYSSVINAAHVLHKSYAAINDYENAYEMAVLFSDMQDSLNKEEDQKALFRQEYQYEYEKKALADSLAQNEAELKLELAHQAELSAETTTRNYLIGAGILLLLLAGGGWSRVQFARKANSKLKVARDKAEESDRFKQRFLANMSHEIRTPMNAVLGMTQLTLDTELTDKQRTYLEAVHHSSENLLVIVNDILDLSKLEQGKLEFEKIPFRLKEQVEQVYQTLQFKAEEKGLEFNVKVAEDIPHRVLGDPSRLIQVLMNLTSNAIKFTKEGSVSIEVEKGEGEQIRFAVKDTGMGIAADKQDQLFESFRQLDESTSRKYGGTGLGLAISKDLVELQGGKISVKSKMYEGSVFSFELNLPKAQVEPALSKELTAESLKGIRILVAEDNQYNQIVVQDTLENLIEGVEVSVVNNGELAVKAFEKESFDVVLMDAHMPHMDGVTATKALRKAGNKTPIIALTASVLNEEIDNCLKAGMNDSLPKPFKREELLEVLGKYYQA